MAKKRSIKPPPVPRPAPLPPLPGQFSVVYDDVNDDTKSLVQHDMQEPDAWTAFRRLCNCASIGSRIRLMKGPLVLAELYAAGVVQAVIVRVASGA